MAVPSLEPPYFLLASPAMQDPNFANAVVLMGHHTKDGALGWIVNRLLGVAPAELLAPPLGTAIHPETPIRVGGPVLSNGLVVVFRSEIPGVEQVEMAPGVRVSASAEILPKLFSEFRAAPDGLLLLGYSGWGPEQLDHEMEEGAWLVLPYDEAFAYTNETEGLWERALQRLGLNPANVTPFPGGVS
ncbi:MAG: YqgE/AlgH family protein [Thermoanaerobaculia bacterium]